ncbi:hypothetical protein [Ideonella sp. B508-1]|uniref:hypothetical protein n=1 Tax=Ideonella sp. B508-1 TaxID=137716 RepID=UPI00034BE098|nr:hypothetical protein [Ideonella sp. B508-1]
MAHRLTLQRFARFLLAWYVAFVGVGTLSPLFKTVDLTLVCSAGGSSRWVAIDPSDDPAAAAAHRHAIDCPLCLPMMAPPAVAVLTTDPDAPITQVLIPPDQRPASAIPASGLSARGPPKLA